MRWVLVLGACLAGCTDFDSLRDCARLADGGVLNPMRCGDGGATGGGGGATGGGGGATGGGGSASDSGIETVVLVPAWMTRVPLAFPGYSARPGVLVPLGNNRVAHLISILKPSQRVPGFVQILDATTGLREAFDGGYIFDPRSATLNRNVLSIVTWNHFLPDVSDAGDRETVFLDATSMAPLPSFVPALGGAAAAAGLNGDAGMTLVEVRNGSGGATFLNVNGPQLMACPVAADIEGTTSNVQVVLRDVNEQPGLGAVDVLLTAGDCADGGRILRVGPDGPLELGASIEVSSSTSLLFAIGKASTQPVVVEGRTQAASTQFTVTRLDARGVTAVRSRSFTVSAMVATTALTVDDSDQPIVLLQAAVVGPLSLMDSLTGVSTGPFTSPSGLVLVQLNNQLELVRVGVIDFPEPLTSRSVSATDGLLLVDFRCLVGGTSSDGGLACRLDESSFAAKLVRRDGGSL